MGTPAPIIVPGRTCPGCWGVGRKFGDIVTPGAITADISSIEGPFPQPSDLPEPPTGSITLAQHPIIPCRFDGVTGVWLIQVILFFDLSTCVIFTETGEVCFRDLFAVGCALSFVNSVTFQYENGSVSLSIPGVNI